MTAVPLGVSNYVRQIGKTPPILLINMFVEKDPSNLVDGLVRLQRPGLAPFATVGSGPCRGMFRQAGTFLGDWLVVSSSSLYRVNSLGTATLLLLSFPGTDRCTFAASATRALIATGGTCYSTDGVTAVAVVMPGGESVSSVAYINGYFILTVAGAQKFFWIPPGGVDPAALDFASAENSPDNIIAVRRQYDELWFFGEASTEVWQTTGDTNAPFQRISGRLYDKGVINGATITTTDNTIFWVGSDLVAYRGDVQPVRISDHSIEEKLRLEASGGYSAWSFALDGHTFYCLRIGALGTFVFDVENPQGWLHWKSYGKETWRAHIGGAAGERAQIIAGDDTTGNLWSLDLTRSNDNGVALVREVMGGTSVQGKPQHCNNFEVFAATGWAPETGVSSEPMLELNWYDDDGEVLSGPWIELSLGTTGQYRNRMIAYQLGLMEPPGRLWHLRMSQDVSLRISYAKMNEA